MKRTAKRQKLAKIEDSLIIDFLDVSTGQGNQSAVVLITTVPHVGTAVNLSNILSRQHCPMAKPPILEPRHGFTLCHLMSEH